MARANDASRTRTCALAATVALAGLLVGFAARATAAREPELYARYELRRAGTSERLVLVRSAERVVRHFVDRSVYDVWQRSARGELEQLEAFTREGKAVHFTEGDLRTIGSLPHWSELASLLDERERARFLRVRSVHVRGRRAELSRGELRGQPAELTWLPEFELPAKLAIGERGRIMTLQLVELAPCTPQLCAPFDQRALTTLEFADLGDKEYDPFVRRFLAHRHGASPHLE